VSIDGQFPGRAGPRAWGRTRVLLLRPGGPAAGCV